MTQIFGYSIPVPPWLALSIFIGGWVALSFFISDLFDRYIRRWAEKTKTRFDKLLVETLHGPLLIFLLLIGGRIALGAAELPPKMARFATVGVSLATAFVLIYAGVKFYHGFLMEYGQRYEPIKPSLGILDLLGKALIILIGLLLTLDSLSISITPLLTTLGIGGLAVALAFRDTLANFFAGLYILADRPVRVGDYIKLEGGPEGYVHSIGWRSTRIRTLPNNIVVMPNSKVSESIITNYFLPERRMALLLNISVSYASDPRRVEKILIEEATRAASEVEGLLADPAPFVRFIPGFGDSSLNFTLICQVREFVDQYFVQHELRHRILERFKKEGVEIPFPQRTVHLRTEGN
ncbi:MAG: mechanosensitive ion channel family protein [Deltaproteobacteria bacterium]|nr:mechanosensitive ion channel family protein [Deltaproteobacteria bacterium]